MKVTHEHDVKFSFAVTQPLLAHHWSTLERTSMFAHVTLHRTFNPLGSKCTWWQDEEAASYGPYLSSIIHRFLSLKVLLLIYLLFKKHYIQFISIRKIVFDLVKGT